MNNDNEVKLITLRTFDNATTAHIQKSRLESEGIECYLFDENMSTLNLAYVIALGGIKLNIKSTDIEKAECILKEIEETHITDEDDKIISCPNCSSTELDTGVKSMKGIKGLLSAIMSFSLMTFPIYYKTVVKCKDCGCEFKYNEDRKE